MSNKASKKCKRSQNKIKKDGENRNENMEEKKLKERNERKFC